MPKHVHHPNYESTESEEPKITQYFEFEDLLVNVNIIKTVQKDITIENTTTIGSKEVYWIKINGHQYVWRYNTNEEMMTAYKKIKSILSESGVIFLND